MALSDIQIRRTDTPGKYAGGRGLFLQAAPNGDKYWGYAYRFGGKQKTLALGTYPDIGLAKARERHQEARTQLAQDIDLSDHKQTVKARKSTHFQHWLPTGWDARPTKTSRATN